MKEGVRRTSPPLPASGWRPCTAPGSRPAASGAGMEARSVGTLHPGVVQDLAHPSGAGHDVVAIVEAPLLVPVGARLGAQHALGGEAAVEADRVDHDAVGAAVLV